MKSIIMPYAEGGADRFMNASIRTLLQDKEKVEGSTALQALKNCLNSEETTVYLTRLGQKTYELIAEKTDPSGQTSCECFQVKHDKLVAEKVRTISEEKLSRDSKDLFADIKAHGIDGIQPDTPSLK